MGYRSFFNQLRNHRHRQHSFKTENLSVPLAKTINSVEKEVKNALGGSSDIVYRRIGFSRHQNLLIIYIDGLVNAKDVNEILLKPLVFENPSHTNSRNVNHSALDIITQQLIPVANVTNVKTLGEVVDGLLKANVAVVADESHVALLAELTGGPSRAIEESQVEPSVLGPHEAFNESLRDTTALIRRRLRDPRLRTESMTMGSISKTNVSIIYLDGIVNQAVLEELHLRLQKVRLESVLDAHYIEEFLEDSPWSPYPQVQNTERPDVVAAALLEGKIAIAVDNTPNVLLVPMGFWNGFQAPDDYYQRSIYVILIRWIRFIMLNLSIFLTPTYVALTSFHPQMLPTNLLITFAASHNGSPFPVIVEALVMELIFEGLREAGVRLPKAVGSAVSIVGGLVVGQAAVEAGFVSAPTVIAVAMSGIASFTIPRYNFGFSYRVLRFFILFLAGMVGLYGITLGFIIILIHQVNLRTLGVPYMFPLSPRNSRQLLDTLLRVPRRYLPPKRKTHHDNPRQGTRPT